VPEFKKISGHPQTGEVLRKLTASFAGEKGGLSKVDIGF
jgi:hypothetical protein